MGLPGLGGGGGGGKGKGGGGSRGGGKGGKSGGGKNGSLLSLPGNIVGGGKGAARGAMGKGGGGKGKGSIPGMLGSPMGKMGQGLGKFGQGMSGMPGLMGQMLNQGMFPPFGQQGGQMNPNHGRIGWENSQQQQPSGAHGFTGQGASGQNHMQQMSQGPSFYGGAQPGQSSNLNWGPNAIGGGSGNSFSFGQQGGSSSGGAVMPNLQEAPPAPWDQRVNR